MGLSDPLSRGFKIYLQEFTCRKTSFKLGDPYLIFIAAFLARILARFEGLKINFSVSIMTDSIIFY